MSRWVACSTIGKDDPRSVLLIRDSSPELSRQKWSPRKAESLIGEKMLRDKDSRLYVGECKGEEVHTRHLLIDTQVPAQSESQHIAGTHRILRCSALLECLNPDSSHQLLFPGIIRLSV